MPKRFTDEEILLGRLQMGWAPQIRHWTLLVSLGYQWAKAPLEHAEKAHREAMAAFDYLVSHS